MTPSSTPEPDGLPLLSVDGPRATIRLARLSQHNRIDPADIDQIMRHLDTIEQDGTVRVLILTGTGNRTFSSGYTLAAIRTTLDQSFETMLDRLQTLSLPTLCVLNGSVYGGATDLALCCDVRIGVRGMRLRMPAAHFGLHYYPGGLQRYVHTLGPAATKKLFLTGQTVDDQTLLRIGFIGELAADAAELETAAQKTIEALLAGEPGVQASMKRHIDEIAAGRFDPAQGRQAYLDSLRSDALAQRLDALE